MSDPPGAERSITPAVAFLGLGGMGGPMADRVALSGFPVCVFDVSEDRVQDRVTAGAVASGSPAAAASGADVVCVVVHDDAQVLDVIDAPLLDAMAPGGVVVLHSTVTLATVQTIDQRCRARERHLLDIGISGGVSGAAAGTLVMLAGGDNASIERVVPVLACYSRQLVSCGPVGSGMAAKAARNLIALAVMALAAEGLAVAEACGVDRDLFAEVCAATDPFGYGVPFIDGSMLSRSGVSVERLRTTGLKDLSVVEAIAADLGVDAPAAAYATSQWDRVCGYLRPGAEVSDALAAGRERRRGA